MRRISTILLSLFITMGTKAANAVVLSYNSLSTAWMGSLPLGNGRIGAMVYGGVGTETIALNEVTLWSGQYDAGANNICGPGRLKEMREAFFRGDLETGNALGNKYLSGRGRSFGTNLPFGDILIEMDGLRGEPSGYRRTLSLSDAVAQVEYGNGGIRYTREYFCSNPAQALVARFISSKKNNLSASISMRMLRYSQVKAVGNQLEITGDARFDKNGEGGVKFLGIVKVITNGGKVVGDGDRLTVTGANSMTVITDIRTDFRNPGYQSQCRKTIADASLRKYEALKKEHVADYSRIFNRMSVDLGPSPSPAQDTNGMFAEAKGGRSNPAFDALFFQYGRYMLISSSRENSPLPAHLQGIWNDNLACNMPWTCDYHLDINIQQNYWSANVANLHECNEPLFGYLSLLSQYGHDTARKMYGCDGWVAHTINNVWGDTAPGSGVGWAMNVTAGAWMATHLWTHYEFTQDKEYLRNTGYPLLKETAKFFVDYMVEDPAGYLVTGPSISPENGFLGPDGKGYSLSMMPTIDRAVVYEIYHACIESARILGIDGEFRTRLERDIKLLPPYRVDKRGELREWMLDVERSDPAHRHASHLVALYPFGHISPERTPDLAKACDVFLTRQTKNGSWEDTEWTRGNMINFYARLKNAPEAYASLKGLYTGFMRENLMTVSPAGVAGAEEDIFSFDATEAAVAGMCEMILQSYDGYLDFLPALPGEWKDGHIRGICARGGIEVDIDWRGGKVIKAVLRSPISQTVKCRINGAVRTVGLKAHKPAVLSSL